MLMSLTVRNSIKTGIVKFTVDSGDSAYSNVKKGKKGEG